MDYRPLRTTRDMRNLQGRPAWYRITNKPREMGKPDVTQVTIYDEIGFLGVSADSFMRDLADVQGDIEMHINSPGGDVFDGIAIYNQLKQRPGVVSVVIDGLAASAASFIAQAASKGQLAMAPHSQMMIHDGFGMTIGNADDMRKTAELLEKASDNIAGIYADRTGKPAEYWRGLMRNETWLSDAEAVAEGLADRVLGQDPPAGGWDLSVYQNGSEFRIGEAKPEKPKKRKRPEAKDYSADDRKAMAAKGQALPDGSFPIADEEDLHNAIGLAGNASDPAAARRHIIKRAKALGASDAIPDSWNADGSTSNLSETEILAIFARELDQLDAGKEQ